MIISSIDRSIHVSVIIPTFNRCLSVKRALQALCLQTFPSWKFEVIVSIDGSTDGTLEMVNNFNSPFTLRTIWKTNSGRAFACNRAVHEAKGCIIIIMDDDMEPLPGHVEAHFSAHLEGLEIGVIGAAPIELDNSSNLVTLYMAERFNSHLKRISVEGYEIRIWDFYSGNFSIRKDVLLKIGGFNESFRIYGYEDVELAERLIGSGRKIIYNEKAISHQYYKENLRSLSKKIINSGKTAVLLVNMHPDTFEELQFREYYLTGWKWRTLRLTLIWFSIYIPKTTDMLVSLINLFENKFANMHRKLFYLAMDYFFWLGVWIAIKNDSNYELMARIKEYKIR